ncbi:MAG: DUF6538 domain-containing protein, partial [Thiotrichales bacterium]
MAASTRNVRGTGSYLVKRGPTYYFQARIPERLRRSFNGSGVYKVSLRTGDETIARARAEHEMTQFNVRIEAARLEYVNAQPDAPEVQREPRTTTLDEALIRGVCDYYRYLDYHTLENALTRQVPFLAALTDAAYQAHIVRRRQALEVQLRTVHDHLERGDFGYADPWLHAFFGYQKLKITHLDPLWYRLRYYLAVTIRQCLLDARMRLKGEIVARPPVPDHPLLDIPVEGIRMHEGRPEPTWAMLREAWAATRDRPVQTIADMDEVLRRFE